MRKAAMALSAAAMILSGATAFAQTRDVGTVWADADKPSSGSVAPTTGAVSSEGSVSGRSVAPGAGTGATNDGATVHGGDVGASQPSVESPKSGAAPANR